MHHEIKVLIVNYHPRKNFLFNLESFVFIMMNSLIYLEMLSILFMYKKVKIYILMNKKCQAIIYSYFYSFIFIALTQYEIKTINEAK